jgi:hypothetical protein
MNRKGCFAALCVVADLAGCTGMRATTAALQVPPPAVADYEVPPPAPPNPPAAAPSETTPSSTSTENAPPPSTNAEVANCVPAKPNPEIKPKPVRKPPPQPAPAASAASKTPETLVDATIRAMPVPVLSILGKRIKGPDGEDLGRVVDVLADASGRVRIAIIDFGGFLGVGDRRIAVEWSLLRFNPDSADAPVSLRVGQDKLKTAPEYKEGPRPLTVMEPAPSETAASTQPAAGADNSEKK